MLRRSLVLLPLLLVIGCGSSLPPSAKHPLLDTAPEAAPRPGLDGNMLMIPTAKSVTVVAFWATWCGPCKADFPILEKMWRERKDGGVAIIGVAADNNSFPVEQFLKDVGSSFPNTLDDASRLAGLYRVTDLPRTLVFDRAGRLRWIWDGKLDEKLDQVVAALLKE